MSTDKEKEIFEKAMGYVDKYITFVNGIDDGLMKVHELIGGMATHVDNAVDAVRNVLDSAQEGVYIVSQKLNEHVDSVLEHAQRKAEEVYPDPTEVKSPVQDDPSVKKIEDLSREEMVKILSNHLGMPTDSFGRWDEDVLRQAVQFQRDGKPLA